MTSTEIEMENLSKVIDTYNEARESEQQVVESEGILDCLTCYNPWVKIKLLQTIIFCSSLWMLGMSI